MKKERIDKLLQARGSPESRTKAQALVMAGVVLVDEKRVEKPSESFAPEAAIRLKGDSPESDTSAAAGLKLEKASRRVHIRSDRISFASTSVRLPADSPIAC